MPPPHTALISDDLTGALDSVVPFARAGWTTLVATDPVALDRALAAGPDVLAVSLNSRELTGEEAAARARHAALALAEVPRLFKKIDSRMKGHVAAETLAIAAVRQPPRLVLCPAIPELGRYVVKGQVAGLGVDRPIPVIPPVSPGLRVDCPDACTDADLDRIVAAGQGALLAGARGLASALARASGRPDRPPPPPVRLHLPMTFLIGSRDLATLDQVARLRAAHPGALWIAAPDGLAAPHGPLPDIAILQAMPGPGADGATVAARLAESLAEGLLQGRRSLLLTGGETAAAALHRMGAGVLRVMGEVLPGMPVSLPLDFSPAPLIVTKSGGFGDPDCLNLILRSTADQKAEP